MMPHSTKPKITQTDIVSGYVMRYFVKHVSRNDITEVSEAQYKNFLGSAYYQCLALHWIIGGNDEDITTTGNRIIAGAKTQNQIIISHYDKQMQGLSRILRNPLEFFSGTNKSST